MHLAQWFPENISTYGGSLDGLFALIFYIVGFWFVLTEALLLFFVVRYHRRFTSRAAHVTGERWRELGWILVPAAIVMCLDFGIDAAGARVWEAVKTARPRLDLELRVTGKQFEWLVTYPGADGRLGTSDDFTLNSELRVPAGKTVWVHLQSRDVIHSFFLPNVRLKQDVVPGRTIIAWFNATKPGEYELACAELCGFGHYTMRGTFIVQPPEAFARWMTGHRPGPAA